MFFVGYKMTMMQKSENRNRIVETLILFVCVWRVTVLTPCMAAGMVTIF